MTEIKEVPTGPVPIGYEFEWLEYTLLVRRVPDFWMGGWEWEVVWPHHMDDPAHETLSEVEYEARYEADMEVRDSESLAYGPVFAKALQRKLHE